MSYICYFLLTAFPSTQEVQNNFREAMLKP